ncbi:MAG: phosphoenolpyruvate--protein phosphotransferase [Sphingomonadaceae bacterium]|nr:phosphoenolpyruvate--protein phosphotransferase [Sphingomonadaceae bacterium]
MGDPFGAIGAATLSRIVLHAPFAGWLAPLAEVPDPVFADGMMGEGVAIDPLEPVVRAPCDAEVSALPASRHAVTLRLANGAELLIHVGLETVALGGEGFTAHVAPGQKVATGDPLLCFDLDLVARRAKSLLSPIVAIGDGFGFAPLAPGRAVAAGEEIGAVTGEGRADADASGEALSAEVAVGAAHGIHARPAAKIAAAAKGFAAEIRLAANGKSADARSPVALMALGLGQGERAILTARGADVAAALAAVAAAVEQAEAAPPAPAAQAPTAAPAHADALRGICAAPGFAVGPAARLALAEIRVEEKGRGEAAERSALVAARAALGAQLLGAGGIAEAQAALLDDPELVAAAEAELAAGRSAGFAWRAATEASANALRATGNPLLIERIDDLHDIERQLLAALAGESVAIRDLPEGAILLADALLPSQLLALDLGRVGGIATARGGATSHAAILAAAAGVPMLVALGDGLAAIAEGAVLILDADAGTLMAAPDAEALAAAGRRVDERRRQRAAEVAAAAEECRMADGTRIEIFANLASAEEAARAVAAGAEGCGLLRTEFLFHDRPAAPSEDEQAAAYAEVARALGGRPLIVRTLDAGGDKPLPYLAMPPEDNPALGLRGVRLSLARPDLLAAQLRAILRAAPAGDLRIMVPMIVDLAELRAVRAALAAEAAALGVVAVPLGVMIETPAAALLAASIAAEADFLSVGTNDLSQYALAADRGNPATAARIDALHPAVLRLVAAAGEGARAHGRWFGICGGVASDPLAAAILIGLGATELSATPAAIPALKAAVRGLDLVGCQALAARALTAADAAEVRALARGAIR